MTPSQAATPQPFNLTISAGTQPATYNIRAESPAGQATATVTLPKGNLPDLLLWVQNLVAEQDDTETLGRALFDFLFPQPIQRLYWTSRPRDGEPPLYIRITLADDAVELHQLPWEYAFDGYQFLAHQPQTPILRHIDAPFGRQLKPLPQPLKLLLAAASPQGLRPTSAIQEIHLIKEALQPLGNSVEIMMLEQTTRTTLFEAVQSFKPDIFHYAGHGGWQEDEGGLFFEKEGDLTADFAPGRDLAVILDSVSFMVLNGCETAALTHQDADDPTKNLLGVAPRLIKRVGVPAVLGMQFIIPHPQAKVFAKRFYTGVVEGKPLTAALTDARRELFFIQQDKNFWAIPALFLRSTSDFLFQTESVTQNDQTEPQSSIISTATDSQNDQITKIVSILMQSPSMTNSETRNDVVNELPQSIQGAIQRRTALNADLRNIVRTVLNYEGGLSALADALATVEGESKSVLALRKEIS